MLKGKMNNSYFVLLDIKLENQVKRRPAQKPKFVFPVKNHTHKQVLLIKGVGKKWNWSLGSFTRSRGGERRNQECRGTPKNGVIRRNTVSVNLFCYRHLQLKSTCTQRGMFSGLAMVTDFLKVFPGIFPLFSANA